MRKLLLIILTITVSLSLVMLPATEAKAEGDEIDWLFGFLKLLDLPQCLLKSYRCVPLGCSVIPPLDLICHNYPAGFVETTTAPFTSTVPFVGTLLSAMSQTYGSKLGSGGAGQQGDANLHYFEAHVFNLPTRTFIKLAMPFLKLCSFGDIPWEVNYLSEIDAISWRTGVADYVSLQFLFGMIAQISQICTATTIADNAGDAIGGTINIGGTLFGDICMGTWGVTYPRTGFSNAQSEPIASAIAAYRASRVVAMPFLRVVLKPKLFDPNLKMQLGHPRYAKPLNCFSKGTSPLFWDNLTTKLPKGQGYIWVLWEKMCCCFTSTGCIGLPPFI